MDEDDGDVASSPFPPAQLDLARLHPWHDRPYLFRPAVGAAPGGVGATGSAETTAPLIMRSVPSGETGVDRSLGHEVDDIDREFHRIVGVDEVPGVRIDLQDRPVARVGHARHERRDDIASEVGQPVEGGRRDERLLVAEREEDRLP